MLPGMSQAQSTDQAAVTVPAPLASCVGCHIPDENGALSRIRDQRKTAEGWEMTINRMRLIHGLTLSGQEINIAPTSMREMVKYLADNQGLAPSESEPYRYLLEQDLNRTEDIDADLAVMCGRCHSSARFALQRRTEDEWEKLVHFHLGQYPSTEYSLYGRDRDWLGQALNESVPALAKAYPLETDAWREWQATPKPALAGRWVMAGHMAGRGDLHAVMTVEGGESDNYSISLEGVFADGAELSGTGKAVVYTGYDWRAQLTLGDITMRQVFAADASGNEMTGRMYLRGQDLQGVRLTAARDDGPARIVAVSPSHIRQGSSQQLVISGVGLEGDIKLPAGIKIESEVSRTANRIEVQVSAAGDAALGMGDVSVGPVASTGSLAVYDAIDQLQVRPAFGVARVGDNGGSTPKVNAAFRAVGVDFGADGEAGTDDDITLGYVDGVNWQVQPWDEIAERMDDVKFAGNMGRQSGIFEPAGAGPNPERVQGTNNAGNLKVVASLEQDGDSVMGEGQLIVTVQRWNNPPLK
jgi:quinohemoprotein amine dehydrogenase